jgi:hypothetical protein
MRLARMVRVDHWEYSRGRPFVVRSRTVDRSTISASDATGRRASVPMAASFRPRSQDQVSAPPRTGDRTSTGETRGGAAAGGEDWHAPTPTTTVEITTPPKTFAGVGNMAFTRLHP